jgi:hypothetical protein
MPKFLNLPHLPSVFHRKQDGECGRLGLLEVQRTFGSFLLVVVLRALGLSRPPPEEGGMFPGVVF